MHTLRKWLSYAVIGVWSFAAAGMSTSSTDLRFLLGFSGASGLLVFLLQYEAQTTRQFVEGARYILGGRGSLYMVITPPLLLLVAFVLLWAALRWVQPSEVLRMLLAGAMFVFVQWGAGAAAILMARRSSGA